MIPRSPSQIFRTHHPSGHSQSFFRFCPFPIGLGLRPTNPIFSHFSALAVNDGSIFFFSLLAFSYSGPFLAHFVLIFTAFCPHRVIIRFALVECCYGGGFVLGLCFVRRQGLDRRFLCVPPDGPHTFGHRSGFPPMCCIYLVDIFDSPPPVSLPSPVRFPSRFCL